MKKIRTEIIIDATPDRVWKTLMNHEKYPNWNPLVKNITGSPKVGEEISVTLQLEGKKPMTMNPTVLKNEEQKEFRWLGHLLIKGLFDGEHYFQLEAIGENQTKFIHGENFSGLLVGIVLKMVGESTLAGFQDMNEALKIQAENN